jgi:hypothetical protein
MANPPIMDEVQIRLGTLSVKRGVAYEPEIKLVNRYFEENPSNLKDQAALISRPALSRRTSDVGVGPINIVAYQSGAFDNDLFVASGEEIYRVKKFPDTLYQQNIPDEVTLITGISVDPDNAPAICITKAYTFVADGGILYWIAPDNTNGVITTPDDVGISHLAYINGFVVCVVADSQRFYWIEPNANTIDVLNFAEAERLPDNIVQAMTLGDQVWLFGNKTSEMWYLSGSAEAPFQRVQGRTFDRGSWEGTAVRVGDAVILVGEDGKVYSVEGGPTRISYNGLEERLRKAIQQQGM